MYCDHNLVGTCLLFDIFRNATRCVMPHDSYDICIYMCVGACVIVYVVEGFL